MGSLTGVFTQDFFGFCFCFGSVQDRLQFFGNGIAYLKLDLLVGGAVAVGSYVKAHDLCSDFLLQTGLAEKIGGSGKDQRRNADGEPAAAENLKCRLELTSMLVPKCISGLSAL